MTELFALLIGSGIGFGLGYWIKSRGVAGILSDGTDAQTQIRKLLGKE